MFYESLQLPSIVPLSLSCVVHSSEDIPSGVGIYLFSATHVYCSRFLGSGDST
jgi:hypothetical protein